MEPIRRGIEGFLRGRYGVRVLAKPALIGAILVAGWLLVGPLLTIPRFTTEGPVVRNGVVAVMVCGKKRGFEERRGDPTASPSRPTPNDHPDDDTCHR